MNATGAVSLGGIANDVDNLEVTTQNGNVAFLDADDLISAASTRCSPAPA